MKRGHCYAVVSPECSAVEPVLDFGQGPREYWRDFVYVYARNARRAKVLGLRWFRRMYKNSLRGRYYLTGGPPFKGMTAVRTDLCNLAGCDNDALPRVGYCSAAHEAADQHEPAEVAP